MLLHPFISKFYPFKNFIIQISEACIFTGDETVADVFRDFSNMGSRNPEKLRREKFTDV